LPHKNPLLTPKSRLALPVRAKPHWVTLEPGVSLGYRRLADKAGSWCCRHYRQATETGPRGYVNDWIGYADDYGNSGGVFSFAQAKAEAESRAKNYATGGSSDYTIAAAVEDYLKHCEDNDKRSVKDMRYRSDSLIVSRLGRERIAKLDPQTLKAWLRNLAKEPARTRGEGTLGEDYKTGHKPAPQTAEQRRQRRYSANKVWAILRAALNHGLAEGKIASNAAWATVKQFEGVAAARVRWLTAEDAAKLVAAADDDFRPLLKAALMTGCRYGELCRLKVSDFADNRGAIQVLISKTGHPRDVLLNDDAGKFFRGHCNGRDRNELMFRHPSGMAWNKSHQLKPMQRAVTAAGIDPANFHCLRHTYASLAVMGGMPLTVLAKQLGHTDTRMVEKHYGHLGEDYVAQQARKFAPSFGFAA
jgi:integrase